MNTRSIQKILNCWKYTKNIISLDPEVTTGISVRIFVIWELDEALSRINLLLDVRLFSVRLWTSGWWRLLQRISQSNYAVWKIDDLGKLCCTSLNPSLLTDCIGALPPIVKLRKPLDLCNRKKYWKQINGLSNISSTNFAISV